MNARAEKFVSVADSVCVRVLCVSVSAYACLFTAALLAHVEAEIGLYGSL